MDDERGTDNATLSGVKALRPLWWEVGLMVAILLLASFLRVYRFREAPPGLQHDEAFEATFATYILEGEFPAFFDANGGEEALYPYLVAASFSLVGKNYFALRLMAVFSGLLAIALTYRLARGLFQPEVALLASAGLALSFWHIFDSRVALRPITLMLMEVASFLLLWLGLKRGHILLFLLSGLFLGLAQYTYTSAPLVVAALLFFALYLLLFHRPSFRRHLWKMALLFLVALLVFLPMGYHLYTHPVASTARARDLGDHLRQLFAGDPRPVLDDVLKVMGMFTFRGDPEWRYNLAGRPIFDPLTSLFFYGGLALSLARWRRPAYAFLLLWLTVNLIISAVTRGGPSTLRAIGSLGAIYLVASIGMVAAWRWLAEKGGEATRKAAQGGVVALLLASGLFAYRDYFTLWARNPEVQEIYRADLTAVAQYLSRLDGGDTVCLSAQFAADLDQGVLSLMGSDRFIRWFNGQEVMIFPPSGEATYIFPATGPLYADFMERYFQGRTPAASPLDPQGVPVFSAYRLGEEEMRDLRCLQPQRSLSAVLEDKVEILGYDLPSQPKAGKRLTFFLYWRVLNRVRGDLDYSFFVHLVDGRGYIWSQGDSLGYPPSSWQEGDLVVERFLLDIPPDMPPLESSILVGMYDRATGERLKAVGGGDAVALGPFTVAQASSLSLESLEIPQPKRRDFDDTLTLLGWGWDRRRVEPGGRINLSLWWQAREKPQADYLVSIFLQGEGGKVWGELVRQPLDGEYPTTLWAEGQVVRDPFYFPIPPEAPPGNYDLRLRLLDPRSGHYLPLAEGEGDTVTLSGVRVLPPSP